MCGVVGFIGESVNKEATFALMDALLEKTERRGEHATGFYACEHGEDGLVMYDKEAIKSTIYTTRDIWKHDFANLNADLMIAHCRQPSPNVGSEKVNKNNHPHINKDKSIALVHNGKVPEYNHLKNRYDLRSDCDSEILLAMYESGEFYKNKDEILKAEFSKLPDMSPDIAYRMMGMKEIFSRINFSAMAVAIAEREVSGNRLLWLFRDDSDRPLHVVDMRSSLGQVFFCSTPEIWSDAVQSCSKIKQYLPEEQKLMVFPDNQIWSLYFMPSDIDGEPHKWEFRKIKIGKKSYSDYDESKDPPMKLSRSLTQPVTKIVTRLNDVEEIIGETKWQDTEDKKKLTSPPISTKSTKDIPIAAEVVEDKRDGESYVKEAISKCTDMLAQIETLVENTLKENGSDNKVVEPIMETLNNLLAELNTCYVYLS